jgi:hypothetical protein
MSDPRRRPLGPEDALTFVRSNPKLGLAFAAGAVCTLVGLAIGVGTNTPEAGLVGGTLLLLGVALLADVVVRFWQWGRTRES